MNAKINMPLVSIGVPVRNGGNLLSEALRQLVEQTYSNIEIIISDNASTDQTAEICQSFLHDERVRYFRQERTRTGSDNFHFVLEKARGSYFMWAAHDDRHSLNYVETLIEAALANPDFCLVHTSVKVFHDFNTVQSWADNYPITIRPEDSFLTKLRKQYPSRCAHFYGLHPTRILKEWTWPEMDYGPDHVILSYIATRGRFVKVDGAVFLNYRPLDRADKNPENRARANSLRALKPFPLVRLCWAMVKAARYGESREGRHHWQISNFILFYLSRKMHQLVRLLKRRAWRIRGSLQKLRLIKSAKI